MGVIKNLITLMARASQRVTSQKGERIVLVGFVFFAVILGIAIRMLSIGSLTREQLHKFAGLCVVTAFFFTLTQRWWLCAFALFMVIATLRSAEIQKR